MMTDQDRDLMATDLSKIGPADLKELTAAVAFAPDFLPDYETADFLRDWRRGADLKPWLEALIEDQRNAAARLA